MTCTAKGQEPDLKQKLPLRIHPDSTVYKTYGTCHPNCLQFFLQPRKRRQCNSPYLVLIHIEFSFKNMFFNVWDIYIKSRMLRGRERVDLTSSIFLLCWGWDLLQTGAHLNHSHMWNHKSAVLLQNRGWTSLRGAVYQMSTETPTNGGKKNRHDEEDTTAGRLECTICDKAGSGVMNYSVLNS